MSFNHATHTIEVESRLSYNVEDTGSIILNIHAIDKNQTIISENLVLSAGSSSEILPSDECRGRLLRLVPGTGPLEVSYSATVSNQYGFIDLSGAALPDPASLHPGIFPFMYPSRYCESDKLSRFANNKFGDIESPFELVHTITDWIHSSVEYISGSSTGETTASDTILSRAGVCRDFAHLGIALCRAMNIPARYCSVYAFDLNPQDFHACFEAWMGGAWIIFDATRLAPLNGLIRIASGRDAADTAISNIYGQITSDALTVSVSASGDAPEPFFYTGADANGLCYGLTGPQ